MRVVTFSVPGVPMPQGNKTGYLRAGRVVLVEGRRPDARAAFASWRALVTERGLDALGGEGLLVGPLALDVVFLFPRPKSHYRTGQRAAELRQSAPFLHEGRPDLDKLLRAIGDALSGSVYRDDAQICEVQARKRYGLPGCEVELRELLDFTAAGSVANLRSVQPQTKGSER